MSYEDKLTELGITLPQAPTPVAAYVPAVRSGQLLFVAGQLPIQDGRITHQGKLGRELTTDEGYQAARLAALNCLAVVRQEMGSLDAVSRVVRLVGHVASAEGFGDQPQVVNGASELMQDVFGEAGRHARLALGCAELPRGAAVELELIVEVR